MVVPICVHPPIVPFFHLDFESITDISTALCFAIAFYVVKVTYLLQRKSCNHFLHDFGMNWYFGTDNWINLLGLNGTDKNRPYHILKVSGRGGFYLCHLAHTYLNQLYLIVYLGPNMSVHTKIIQERITIWNKDCTLTRRGAAYRPHDLNDDSRDTLTSWKVYISN